MAESLEERIMLQISPRDPNKALGRWAQYSLILLGNPRTQDPSEMPPKQFLGGMLYSVEVPEEIDKTAFERDLRRYHKQVKRTVPKDLRGAVMYNLFCRSIGKANPHKPYSLTSD